MHVKYGWNHQDLEPWKWKMGLKIMASKLLQSNYEGGVKAHTQLFCLSVGGEHLELCPKNHVCIWVHESKCVLVWQKCLPKRAWNYVFTNESCILWFICVLSLQTCAITCIDLNSGTFTCVSLLICMCTIHIWVKKAYVFSLIV